MIVLTSPDHKAEYKRLLTLYGEAVATRYAIVVVSHKPKRGGGAWSKIISQSPKS